MTFPNFFHIPLIALTYAAMLFLLPFVLVPRHPDLEKNSSYECGFDPFLESRVHFSVQYYLIAILFLVFDLEVILLFPLLSTPGLAISQSVTFFYFIFLILLLGLAYEWSIGSLEW